MANPFRSLKSLPWTVLFQCAGVTLLISVIIELALVQVVNVLGPLMAAEPARGLFAFFLVLLPILIAFGLGALALAVAARLFQRIPLRKDTMWALVLCVIVLLPFKNLLLLYSFSVRLNIASICLVAAGVFTAGRRYWR